MSAIAMRLNRGLSLRAAADEIGVDRRTLEKLEKGHPIREEIAKRIADFYGCQVTDIADPGAWERAA